jgi:hypothetical protein
LGVLGLGLGFGPVVSSDLLRLLATTQPTNKPTGYDNKHMVFKEDAYPVHRLFK